MTKNTKQDLTSEIKSLNLDDLDVNELERRLELAAAVPSADCHTKCKPNSAT
jgi:hypothetical protein